MAQLEEQTAALHDARGSELMAGKTEPSATRNAYGAALVELGEAHEDVVALDADLSVSTQSAKFGNRFPDRFFNVGAAEANMMSMACGLAATGKRPYASTFAIFATGRAYDQIRLGIAHNELPVRICASHGGVSLGEDGASHQMIEDIALMRAMPKMTVVVPADYNQAYRATLDSYESRRADVHALRPARDAGRLRGRPRDARPRRRRPARGQGHLADRDRPHGLARARGGRRRSRARTGSRPR